MTQVQKPAPQAHDEVEETEAKDLRNEELLEATDELIDNIDDVLDENTIEPEPEPAVLLLLEIPLLDGEISIDEVAKSITAMSLGGCGFCHERPNCPRGLHDQLADLFSGTPPTQ